MCLQTVQFSLFDVPIKQTNCGSFQDILLRFSFQDHLELLSGLLVLYLLTWINGFVLDRESVIFVSWEHSFGGLEINWSFFFAVRAHIILMFGRLKFYHISAIES